MSFALVAKKEACSCPFSRAKRCYSHQELVQWSPYHKIDRWSYVSFEYLIYQNKSGKKVQGLWETVWYNIRSREPNLFNFMEIDCTNNKTLQILKECHTREGHDLFFITTECWTQNYDFELLIETTTFWIKVDNTANG